jgi:hypothetical protein
VRLLLLSLISIVISGCVREGPTGYKAGPSYPGDSNLVKTCDETIFMDEWWSFETNNAIANTLVPAYKDYCTYTSEDYVFYWDTEELSGYYDYGWEWKCVNENTMRITNYDGDEINMRIYGSIGDDCYDVKITYGSIVINGDLCSCDYNGP